MDYRFPLFKKLDNNYNIFFLLWESSDYDNLFNYTLAKGKPKKISKSDIFFILKMLINSNVVITSFLNNQFTAITLLLNIMFRRKVIVWEEIADISKRKKITFYKIFSKLSDYFFVPGYKQKLTLAKLGVNPEKIKIYTEYPGFIYKYVIKKRVELVPYHHNLLFIGRFIEVKGLKYLLEAFYEIKSISNFNVGLFIAGDGTLEEEHKELIRKLNLQDVHFLGRINTIEEKAFLYDMADVLIVPSIIDENGTSEGGPMVVVEALSAGTPVIITDAAGGALDILLNKKFGLISLEKNSLDLALKINDFLYKKERNEYSKEEVFENFIKLPDFDTQFSKLKDLIDN